MKQAVTLLVLFLMHAVANGQTESTWVGGGSDDNWSTPDNWTPSEVPNNGMDTYEVTADGATITLDTAVTISKLVLNLTSGLGVGITGSGSALIVDGATIVDNGQFLGSGVFLPQGTVDIDGSLYLGGTWRMTSTDVLLGTGGGSNSSVIMEDGAEWINDGAAELLDDSDVEHFGGGVLFTNNDLLLKSGGTGQSDVAVPFRNADGTIQVASGTLNFSNSATLDAGTVQASGTGQVRFQSFLTANGTTVLSATGGGEVTFDDVFLRGGTFSGGADLASTIQFVGPSTLLGATLDFAGSNPAEMRGVALGDPNNLLTNQGHLDWLSVSIGNVRNDADGQITILSGEPGTTSVNDAFTNAGTVQQRTVVQMNGASTVSNMGTWQFDGGFANLNLTGTSNNPKFINAGDVLVNLPAATNDAIVHPAFVNLGGTIRVKNGELRLGDPNLVGGIVICQPTVLPGQSGAPAAQITFGTSNSSIGELKDVNFSLFDGSKARFQSGAFGLSGLISATGDGEVENAATLISTQPVLLNCAPTAFFDHAGTLIAGERIRNRGTIQWAPGGTLFGSNELRNAGSITALGMILGQAGTSGTLVNRGQLTIPSATSMFLGTDSLLQNDPNGVVTLNSTTNVTPVFGTTGGRVQNTGTIRKASGGGTNIATEFVQTGGRVEVQSGSMTLTGPRVELLGGELAPIGNGTALVANADTQIGAATCLFDNGGEVRFPNGASTYELSGNLKGSGNGRAILQGGTLRAKDGMAASFEFAGASSFEVAGGVAGAGTDLLVNHGNFTQSAGDVVGLFSNEGELGGDDPALPGNYLLKGGRLQATFQNLGDFAWQEGGVIEGVFTNNPDATFTLLEDDALLLAANAAINNGGAIEHAGGATLEMGEDAQINISAGATYTFTGDGGDIVRPSASIQNAKVTLTGEMKQDATLPCNVSVLFESVGGTIDADQADLNINGIDTVDGDPIINSGRLEAGAGDLLMRFPKLFGSIVHATNVNGVIRHVVPTVDATFVGTGSGRIELAGGVLSTADFQLQTETELVFQDVVRTSANATSTGGTLRFEGGALRLFEDGKTGGFAPNSQLTFASGNGSSQVQISGPDGGARALFDVPFGSVATLEAGADLAFDGNVEYRNGGDLLIQSSSGDLVDLDFLNNDVLFTNNGLVEKSDLPNNTGSSSEIDVRFVNNNTVRTRAGALSIAPFCLTLDGTHLTGGKWIVDPNSSLNLNLGETITENDGEIVLRGNGSFSNMPDAGFTGTFENDGILCLQNGAVLVLGGEFENNGTLKVDTGNTLIVDTFDNDGEANINGTLSYTQSAFHNSGCFSGVGTITGPTLNNSACISPGNSPGVLTINANVVCTPLSTFEIELGGTTPGSEYDQLVIGGTLDRAGTLAVALLDGWEPDPNDTFVIVDAVSMAGSFTNEYSAGPSQRVRLPGGSFELLDDGQMLTLAGFEPCSADVNGNGTVDLTDLSTLLANFGAMDAARAEGDLNGDGVVGLTDLSILLADFGQACL